MLPEPEVHKRPRDELTERLIQEALEDEARHKREKKGLPPVGTGPVTTKKSSKGKTLAEIEDEEGGPVKESLVGMAHVKRATRRRAGTAAEDTDIPGDIAAAEEHYEGDDSDADADDDNDGGGAAAAAGSRRAKAVVAGTGSGHAPARAVKKGGGATAAEVAPLPGGDAAPITAFNLSEERREGHFDEEGNYVFDRGDPDDRDDEWLRSEEGKAVANEVLRKKVEAEHEAMRAAEAAPKLGEAAIAQAQLEMSALMQPGETVVTALKRLRGGNAGPKKAMGKREKARLAKLEAERAAKAVAKGSGAEDGAGAAAEASFQRLTELADMLVSSGELDVYGSTCEQLRRWAALVLPQAEVDAAAGGGKTATVAGGGGGGGDAVPLQPAVDADEDMFASDDEKAAPAKPLAAAKPAAATSPVAQPVASTTAELPGEAGLVAPQHDGIAATSSGGGGGGCAGGSGGGEAAAGAGGIGEDAYASWPIKELRRFLQERGQDTSGIVEKGELVSLVRKVAAQGPARAAPS